ncbi:ribosome dissociation factor [Maudiozyma humilis]|uniref:Protein DOM34 homolog n=1 Tax=Maudiozyma humilis TaxID=51915 RepID=A0AAV5S185_MAUHU|nr:ribosome dissociation factor [Kazachstania humilis]
MKILKLEEGSINKESAVIKVLPEDKEDLFALYQIIDEEDELIFKKKFTSKKDEDSKKNTDLVLLKVQVVSSEFDINDEFLRYKGKTVADETGRANAEVPVGKFISFTVNYSYPFTIIKQTFDKHSRKLLNEACNPEAKSDGAAVVLQEGIAHVCLLTPSSTILKQKIEYSLPKKKRGTDVMKYDEKTEKFYKAIYAAMKKYYDFNTVKMIILCSPGFYAKTLMDKVLEYAREERNSAILNNKSRFLVAHCSTGYLQGIGEVLKDPAYAASLSDTKYSKEATVMDDFLKHLNDDDYKAWYGDTEVFKAAELGAISNLLITDEKLHTGNVKERKVYLDVMDTVERNGGSVFTFSTLHETGEELDKLTGIACILKYPLPDLDEDIADFD